ncbi:MAG: glycosyltransferase family 4 protein [Acidobacteriota bacterium]
MSLDGKRVLYISYNGMLDPLGQSQVIPYLKELSHAGVRFTLLSFERERAYTAAGGVQCRELQRELAQYNIDWHWLRYHKRPSLPATMFDVAQGIRLGRRLVKQNNIELVHARSHVAARMGLALKRRFGLKFIFDVRGLIGDEYVDAGHWRKDSIYYSITKASERKALAAADGVVTLTEAIWPFMAKSGGLRGRRVVHEVVPCCADLNLFKFNPRERERLRKELGVEDRFVIVYSGSIDGWYLTEEMADFFVTLRQSDPRAHLLWLITGSHARIRELMQARGMTTQDYLVHTATTRDVPSYLSASDAGLAFIKPCFSKLASSPTKFAEYLACGLPIVINRGIGDSDSLAQEHKIAAMVGDFNPEEYAKAAEDLFRMTADPESTRRRTGVVAEKLFDVRGLGLDRYVRLYENVFA